MVSLTITQRIKMIRTYYKNGDSATATYRDIRGDYGLLNRSTTQAIGRIVKIFDETGMVTNIERPVYYRFARSAENIAFVSESFAEDPNVSNPRNAQQLGLSYDTLWRILHSGLHLHLCEVRNN